MPRSRRQVIRALIKSPDGILSTNQVMAAMTTRKGVEAVQVSKPTALRVMRELIATGAAKRVQKAGGKSPDKIGMPEKQQWLLSADYRWITGLL